MSAECRDNAGEVNWWSNKEELRKSVKTPQTQERWRIAGFLP